jgi:NAD+ synthase (glutamine-hydrolysing)
MNCIKIAGATLNQTPLDWIGNTQNILDAIHSAKKQEVSILCLPELAVSGYGCEDAFHAPATHRQAMLQLEKIAPHTKNIFVCLGLPLFFENHLFNAVGLCAHGKLLGFVCKQFLAGDGVHYEQRWFKPWPKNVQRTIRFRNKNVPIGNSIFQWGSLKIAVEICEDAWVGNRPARDYAMQGVDILLNPSASHFALGKLALRKQIVLESSRAFHSVCLYTNLNGCEAGRMIYDGGTLVAQCGSLLLQGKRFHYEPQHLDVVTVDLDLSTVQKVRNLNTPVAFEKNELPALIAVPGKWKSCTMSPATLPESWESSKHIREEEFTRAVGLGLYDYLRKSRSCGFVLSLSGGVDSGACAVLIHYMVQQMRHALGEKETLRRFSFSFFPKEKKPSHFSTFMARLLTCVYQSTENSSAVTEKAASALAKNLNTTFYHWKVETLVQQYRKLVENSLAHKLTWEDNDLALQNIQARTRGPSVWLLANVTHRLLLTTSNRSEAAVGYATMDGDTCGGLCPLGGIDKDFLIHWMRWVQSTGPENLGALPVVKHILDQKPSAELRPLHRSQTDEEDLMPYWLLALIEKAAIRDRKSPTEVFLSLSREKIPELNLKLLHKSIKKFFHLFRVNQWKRERYAPSFHLDEENLDPKTWCRYPILSGNLDLEMKALDKAFQTRVK